MIVMQLTRRQLLASGAAAPLLRAAAQGADEPPAEYSLYIGAYTNGASKGILLARFNSKTGTISTPELAVATPNPTFLAIHPGNRFIYAVNEVGSWNGQKTGIVSAFSIEKGGKLRLLNQVSSKGSGPCHVALDSKGRVALVANYGSGSIASYKLASDGQLSEAVSFFQDTGYGPNKARQEGPHAHSNTLSADNRYVVSCDLGTDRLSLYELDTENAQLVPSNPPFVRAVPGGGPRHFTFHPNDKFAYVCNEILSSVTAFQWNRFRGELTEIQTVSALPKGFSGENTAAEIRIHPLNGHLYVSNRGHNSIAVFDITKDGKLALVEITPTGGKTPRNFNFDPTGRWLLAANQGSDDITVLEVVHKKATLRATGNAVKCGTPLCLRFLA
jgi:6-phosphogluconolactonase